MEQIKVLVVEDEGIVAQGIETRLKSLGYGVAAVVSSGRQALEATADMGPDVVLMDIQLKGPMDGIEAAEQIRTRFGVPVVFLTAYADEATLQRAKISEPFGYILKPFKQAELRSTLEMALYKHRIDRELQRAHDELEQRVQERTAELEQANQALRAEIAERERAEAARRRAEKKYQDIFENALEGIFQTTPGGQFLTANPAMARILGYDSPQALVEGVNDIGQQFYVDPERRSEFERLMRAQGFVQGFVSQIQRPDGRVVWLSEHTRAVHGDDGQVSYYEGTVQDITEQMQAQATVRLLSSAVEQSSEGIAVSDLEGNLLFVNRAFAGMHGYTPRELDGEHLDVFHTSEQLSAVEAANRQILETGEFAGEIWHVRRDGASFPGLMHNSLLRDENGEAVGMVGTLRDITELKRAEQALREREELYRAMFERNRAVKLLIDPQTGAIVDANPAAAEFYGYSLEALKGLKITDINTLPPEQVHQEMIQAELEGRACFVFCHRLASGQVRDVEIHSGPIEIQGRRLLFSIVHDITERVEAQQALQQAHDELEERVWMRTAELEETNQQLHQEIVERKRMEVALRDLTHRLDERVKELDCLYSISNLANRQDLSVEEVLQGTVELMPASWQYPDVACARVVLDGQAFATDNYKETIWKQSRAIRVHGQACGQVEVCYLEPRPASDVGPFLKEEENLLNAVAERLGEIVERRRAQDALQLVVEGTAGVTGKDFFRSLVKRVAEVFHVRYAFVSELADEKGERLRLVAFWAGEDFAEPFEYDIAGTPCKEVVGKGLAVYPCDVQNLFPEDYWLKEADIESYLAIPLFDSNGNALGHLGVMHDRPLDQSPFTESILRVFAARTGAELERKQAEDELLKLWRAIEQSPSSVAITNLDADLEYVNPRFTQVTGYRAQEVLGQNPRILKSDKHPPEFYDELWEILAAGGEWRGELCNQRKDGELYWEFASISAVRNAKGEVTHYVKVAEEITERVRVQQALRASEAKFREMLESAPDAVTIVDREGRITLVNAQTEETFGYSRDTLIGQPIQALIPERFRQSHARLCADYASEPRTRLMGANLDIVARRSDGSEFPVDIKLSPLQTQEGLFVTAIIRDVTERVRAQEALRRYADQQTALYTVASAVATTLEPDELLSTVLAVVALLLDANAAWIMLAGDTMDDPLRLAAWRGISKSFLRNQAAATLGTCQVCSFPAGDDGSSDQTLSTQVEWPPTVFDCPRLPPEVLSSVGLSGHVCIPLSAGGQVQGILNVAWRTPHALDESDRALLVAIGRQVGVALHNAQLYQAARQVDRLRVLNELDHMLAASLEPKKVAEATLHQVVAALGAPRGALILCDLDRQESLQRVLVFAGGWKTLSLSRKEIGWVREFLRQLQDRPENGAFTSDALDMFIASMGHPAAQSWGTGLLVVPVWNKVELVALMALGRRSGERPFTDEDRALAQAAAGRAGQAIQNARLYQASQERAMRLATLNTISAAAVSSLDLDEVLHQIVGQTCQALDAAEGSILLRDPVTDELFFAVTVPGEENKLYGQRLAPGLGVAGWVVDHGQPLRVNDVRNDARWHSQVDVDTGFETRSLLCAPLMHREQAAGAIEIVNKRQGEFSEEDLNLLVSVASIAVAALENARLFSASQARVEELALLNEIGLALTSTLDPAIVLHAALSQIQRLFQADGVSLLQPDPQTGALFFVRSLFKSKPVEISLRLPPGKGLAAQVLAQRKPLLIHDAQEHPHFLPLVDECLDTRARAIMLAPLLTPEQAVGVIAVVSEQRGVYTSDDLRALQAVASTLAVALENARLYEEQKQLLLERERAQAQLIHSEKMSALGRLVASIAHEINNPLQSMQGCLTLAQEELDDGQRPEKLNRYMGIVEGEVERIAAIVQRMRDFYRPPQAGMERTDLHAVLESVLALTNKQLQHSNVVVERHWVGDLPQIWANPDHLKQVFLNLVLNAIDAMPQGGVLRLLTERDQIQQESDPPRPAVRVDFGDTGVGMSPEVQARLFEPFFTTKEKGSGLGLSVSYGIIQSHRGQMMVHSQEGGGTTFVILLPLEPG